MPVRQMGALTCTVGPAPVATPPVVPPTTGASKPGDQSPPLAQLVAKDGSVWTLVAGQALRNGVNTKNPYSPGIVHLYVALDSGIRSQNANGTYACWLGTAWGC